MRGFFELIGARGNERGGEYRVLQLDTVFRQMPIALGVNTVNAAITAIVLQRLAGAALPLTWLCVVLLVTTARSLLWLRYRRGGHSNTGGDRWALLGISGYLLGGFCWGLGGVALFPVLPALGQMFVTLVIGGMSAGAVVTSSPHLPTFLAFLLSATLPM